MVDSCFHSLEIFNYLIQVCSICLAAMSSACICEGTLRNITQIYLIFEVSIHQFAYNLTTLAYTDYCLISSILSLAAGTSKAIPPNGNLPKIPVLYPPPIPVNLFNSLLVIQIKTS